MSCPLFEGEHTREVAVFGQTVDIWLKPVTDEVQRRAELGVGAIADHDSLRALMEMPQGLPVDMGCLDANTLLAMDDLLAISAITMVGSSVCRRAVLPVELVGLSKVAEQWSDVQAVTLLRTHCSRYVLAPLPMAKRTLREIDTDVGVAVRQGSGHRIVRRPGARAVRPSWQRWAVAEAAYAQWLRALSPAG